MNLSALAFRTGTTRLTLTRTPHARTTHNLGGRCHWLHPGTQFRAPAPTLRGRGAFPPGPTNCRSRGGRDRLAGSPASFCYPGYCDRIRGRHRPGNRQWCPRPEGPRVSATPHPVTILTRIPEISI